MNTSLDDLCAACRVPNVGAAGPHYNPAMDGPLIDFRAVRCGDMDPDRVLFTLHALRVGCDSAESSMLLAEELVGQELSSLSRTYDRMFAATTKQNQLKWMEHTISDMSARVRDLLTRTRTSACGAVLAGDESGSEADQMRRVIVIAESAVGGTSPWTYRRKNACVSVKTGDIPRALSSCFMVVVMVLLCLFNWYVQRQTTASVSIGGTWQARLRTVSSAPKPMACTRLSCGRCSSQRNVSWTQSKKSTSGACGALNSLARACIPSQRRVPLALCGL